MIKKQILESPVLVSDFVSNIKCVVQNGFFLGKECEVLSEDPRLDRSEILQSIEKTFDRVVQLPGSNSEWVQLEACMMMYDHLLAYRDRNIEMLAMDRVCMFASLIDRIDETCLKLPQTGQDLVLEHELQEILTKCRSQSFAKSYLQALLTYLIVNQRLIETTTKYNHLRLQELFYLRESKAKYTVEASSYGTLLIAPEMIETPDVEALSELDLGLGLRLASLIEKDDQNRIHFKAKDMTRREVERTIEVLFEVSKKEEISPRLKRFVEYTIDFAFWRYITSLIHPYRNGAYRTEYKQAIDQFHTLFPRTCYDQRIIFMEHWPFENIGICKRIFEENKRYGDLSEASDQVEFDQCFKAKCHIVKYRQLVSTYQQIYEAGYKILFVLNTGLSKKQTLEAFSFQKFYQDRSTILLTPEKFSGKKTVALDETPKKIPENESKVDERKEHSQKKKNKTKIAQLQTTSSISSSKEEPSSSYQIEKVPAKKSLKFDPRVIIWFADKAAALEDPKYKDLPSIIQEKATVFHSIGLEVIDLLVEHGVKSSWGQRKLPHYSLACEVAIQGHLQKYRGIITICFNEKDTIYHYGFTDKPANEIVAEYMKKRFWDLDFPTLDLAKEKPIRLPAKVNAEDGSFLSRKINTHTFELIDNKNKAIILLFIPEYST